MTDAVWRPAYIGVGSNLDGPEQQVARGIERLTSLPKSTCCISSSTFRSAALGDVEQPDFVNAVAGLLTQLAPGDLLSLLKEIEREHGRTESTERWGPRTLDLDLLALGTLSQGNERLTLPHSGIAGRNFVLLPWNEIAPRYQIPGLGSVRSLAVSVSNTEPRIEKISASKNG